MLGTASREWATRPADQRHWSLDDLHESCLTYRREAKTAHVAPSTLAADGSNETGELLVRGAHGVSARLTNYSFGQLARLGHAPAGYLASLPAELAAQCLNRSLQLRARADDTPLSLLFRVNGSIELRAALSDSYTRVWNSEITSRLRDLGERGWRVPPAMPAPIDGVATRIATEADCGAYTLVKPGDAISPSGLYSSDRDLFAFLIHPDRVVQAGGGRALFRGFFCWNSEVGDKSFGIQTFLFDYVCFNHNVWGAENLAEVRVRHVGRAYDRSLDAFKVELRKYEDASVGDDELRIARARRYVIAQTKDEVLDTLFGRKQLGLSRTLLDAAYDAAAKVDAYGDPRTAWGISQGLTEVSQLSAHADARVAIDRAAGKIVEMAF